jgi:hypothetical protein
MESGDGLRAHVRESTLNEVFFTIPHAPFTMIVRVEPLWEGEGEEEELKGWLVCVEGREQECFTVRQLYINGELEKDPSYTVYFFEATEVRICGEDEAEVYG